MKYCTLRKGSTENRHYQYYPMVNDITEKIIIINYLHENVDSTRDIRSNIALALRQKGYIAKLQIKPK